MRNRCVLAVLAMVSLASVAFAQTNPLWREEKVKNYLPHMTSPEVRDLLTRTDMVLIPVPSIEQHGFHGPLGTDFYGGIETTKLIAQRTDILVAPILMVGQAGYHMEYLFPSLMSMDKAQTPTLTLTPPLAALLPLVKSGDQAATLVFLAEGLKPKATGKGTSAAEMSSTGSWSERDPRQATVEEGRRTTESAVNAAVAFIDRWKALRPNSR